MQTDPRKSDKFISDTNWIWQGLLFIVEHSVEIPLTTLLLAELTETNSWKGLR